MPSLAFARPLSRFLQHHETLLWGLHSAYALAFGVAFMWLGARDYLYLRLAVLHITFIWVASLIVPALVDTGSSSVWRTRVRMLLNYISKNFYQQLLFFLLPIYYASATWGAGNMMFVVFLGLSAVLSTLDVFYDRHLSVRRGLAALFFAFNLFACVNVMLPVVWSIGNAVAMRLSAAAALAALLTIGYRGSDLRQIRMLASIAASTLLLYTVVTWGAWLIPPAPLRTLQIDVGAAFDEQSLSVASPLGVIRPGAADTLYAVSAIRAPLGLEDRVRHEWYHDGTLEYASPLYRVQGGRTEGFRLWTHHALGNRPLQSTLRLDVRTEAGQLIGRTEIPVRR